MLVRIDHGVDSVPQSQLGQDGDDADLGERGARRHALPDLLVVDGGKGQNELKIGNVDLPVAIDVYNLEGNLVHSQTATQSGDVVWDLTTQSGFFVSSGTYLVRIDNGVSAVVLPIVVVR